ncbi:MAG: zinc ABC transporter substrate-binding protein ZnuA [Candidatus Puniceispirillaceae bacterium]
MRYFRTTIFATAMLSSATISAQADVYVVASIKPIHSLVSAVMQGVGEPSLLIEGAGSPHNYALKPSQAYELEKANLIFWIGHDLEAFLQRTIENIAPQAVSVPLIESHGIKTLPFREGASFEEHDHDKHDEHDHDKHDEHDHGEFDPHVWLDPNNAKILVAEIEEQLTKIYPKHADTFAKNANTITKELDALRDEINLELKDVKSKGYIVFHDAYQYFERRFDMSALGSITVSPEVMPGVNRIRKLQQKVKQLEAICVFSEPQFEPKLVATITENTSAGSGVLDPLGASIEKGPQLYFKLIRNMALSIKECLSKHD